MKEAKYYPGRDLLFEVLLLAAALTLTTFLWNGQFELLVLLTGLIAIKLLYHKVSGDILFLLAGCLIGGLFEVFMSRMQVVTFTDTWLLEFPVWLLPLWAILTNVMRRFIVYVEFLSAPDKEARFLAGPPGEAGIFLLLLVVVGVWQPPSTVSAILLAALIVTRMLIVRESGDPLLLIAGILVGLALEAFFVDVGIYEFAGAQVLGVPSWIPLFWGYTLLVARRVIRPIEARVNPLLPIAA